jgi:pyridoxal 5'-phosphate synthase pdxT subunit
MLESGGQGPKAPGVRLHVMVGPLRIGVLAVQGNFREHAAVLRRLDADPVEVRKPEQLDGLDALVVPGGESTAIRRLMRVYELEEQVAAFPGPLFGTCAGMILFDREHLGLLDVTMLRNGYGRQVASFEADVDLEGETEPVRGVFIRAPRVQDVGDEVEILGRLGDEPVLVREGRVLAASFHPELTDDARIHERFLKLVREEGHVRA